ncbi:hypothetical protein KL86DPRO_10774 [uncultured delta proteobacterium]|uniref:Uncharacterized protein n=1 Tax=uncultured delta proteobacterium TaxID=34034 RepID=A0A212J5Z0_9DELT|nr:hypothetical protein KL86DPRO_10774 [uncultured delta proteobacterium]
MAKKPEVVNEYFLEDIGVTFIIKAFRTLTELEKRQAAVGYLYTIPRSERPKKGDTVTIDTHVVFSADSPTEVLVRSKPPRPKD